jgi:hypothetical protein
MTSINKQLLFHIQGNILLFDQIAEQNIHTVFTALTYRKQKQELQNKAKI